MTTPAPITWEEFQKIDLRVGTVIRAEPFPEAHKPAYTLWVDYGPAVGVRKSSAQITDLYTPDALVGRQVIGVVNLPPKQVGPRMSEALVTGFVLEGGTVVLAQPERPVPNGTRLA